MRGRVVTLRGTLGVATLTAALVLTGCADEPAPVEPLTPSGSASSSPTESSSPSPSPSVSLPLSPLEDDPGVQALRRFYEGFARAVDGWDFTVPELTENAGPELVAALPERAAVEEGRTVPGPVPFTPVELTADAADRKVISYCVVDDGWTRAAGSDVPAAAKTVVPLSAVVVQAQGRWTVTELVLPSDQLDCSAVTIQEVYF